MFQVFVPHLLLEKIKSLLYNDLSELNMIISQWLIDNYF